MTTPPRTLIGDLAATAAGSTVRLCGWVERAGGDGSRRLPEVRDVTGAVALARGVPTATDPVASSLATVRPGSAVEVVGRVASTGT
ncbi:MAG: hypothetical protein M3Z84_06515, partial [Actinomycetota bacterium]|nr:hypothetical protein [Actinomycetota bacterium]